MKKKGLGKLKSGLVAWLLLLPALIAIYLMVWRPQVMGVALSFFKLKGYSVQEFCGLDNYIRVLSSKNFPLALKNTLLYVFWSFTLGFLPPLLVAFFINEMVHFKNGFKTLIYLPALMPGITVMLLWKFMYSANSSGLLNMILAKFGMDPYGWLNHPNTVILMLVIEMTWCGFPGTMFLYYTTLQGIQMELYEAAMIDGAGPIGRFIHVSIPQMGGLLALNIVNQIIGVFQVMNEPLVMTGGGPNGASMSVSYLLYRYAFLEGKVGDSLALGTIIFLILMVATCFYFYLNKKVEENL